MHSHKHDCTHETIKYCKTCYHPYCVECGMEWRYTPSYWYTTGYLQNGNLKDVTGPYYGDNAQITTTDTIPESKYVGTPHEHN